MKKSTKPGATSCMRCRKWKSLCERGAIGRLENSRQLSTFREKLTPLWGIAGAGRRRPEEVLETVSQVRVLELALPKHQHSPSQGFELGSGSLIPGGVATDLRCPVVRIGIRGPATSGTVMPVPPTAMNKNDGAPRWKDKIRAARQIAAM